MAEEFTHGHIVASIAVLQEAGRRRDTRLDSMGLDLVRLHDALSANNTRLVVLEGAQQQHGVLLHEIKDAVVSAAASSRENLASESKRITALETASAVSIAERSLLSGLFSSKPVAWLIAAVTAAIGFLWKLAGGSTQ